MADQATDLRRLVCRASAPAPVAARPRLTVVAGGKGGVGTTALALNLAVAAAASKSRTALVDADADGPGIATLCRIDEQMTLADVLCSRRTAAEAFQPGPGKIRVLPGDWGAAGLENSPAAIERLIVQIQSLGSLADLVLFDVGDGAGRTAWRLWRAADEVLLVVTPDTPAITSAYAAIKILAAGSDSVSLRVLVNQATSKKTAEEAHARLTGACARFLGFSPRLAGCVPRDPKVSAACTAGEPFVLAAPDCPAAREVRRLAEGLTRRSGIACESARTTRKNGLVFSDP